MFKCGSTDVYLNDYNSGGKSVHTTNYQLTFHVLRGNVQVQLEVLQETKTSSSTLSMHLLSLTLDLPVLLIKTLHHMLIKTLQRWSWLQCYLYILHLLCVGSHSLTECLYLACILFLFQSPLQPIKPRPAFIFDVSEGDASSNLYGLNTHISYTVIQC